MLLRLINCRFIIIIIIIIITNAGCRQLSPCAYITRYLALVPRDLTQWGINYCVTSLVP